MRGLREIASTIGDGRGRTLVLHGGRALVWTALISAPVVWSTSASAGPFAWPFKRVQAVQAEPAPPAAATPAPAKPKPLDARPPAAANPAPIAAPAPFPEPGCGSNCLDGVCPPYYRNRPPGKHQGDQMGTIINNRTGEPNWYKYYRCEHYGYYPPQWAAWPNGWLSCRRPFPGPHPYDLKQPESKSAPRKDSRPPAASQDRRDLPPLRPPANPENAPNGD